MKFGMQRWSSILCVLVSLACCGLVLPSRATAQGNANVRKAQTELQSSGYYHGKIDGLDGPQTRSAIRQYQQAEHLPVNGRLDSGTAGKLGVSPVRVHHAHTKPVETGNLKAAKHSVGRGGKEFGHAMKKGKPVVAAKDLGKSIGHASKEVGKAAKKAVKTH